MIKQCKLILLAGIVVASTLFGLGGVVNAAIPSVAGPITLPFIETLVFDEAHGAVSNDVIDAYEGREQWVLGGYSFSLDDTVDLFYKGYSFELDWCMPIYLFEAHDLDTVVTGGCGSYYWQSLYDGLPAGDYVVFFADDGYDLTFDYGTYIVDAGLAIREEGHELVSVAGVSIPPIAGLGDQICIEEDGEVVKNDCDYGWNNIYQYSINVPYSKSTITLADFVANSGMADIYASMSWDDFWNWNDSKFLGSTPVSLAVGANVVYVEVYNSYTDGYVDYMITINRAGADTASSEIGLPGSGFGVASDGSGVSGDYAVVTVLSVCLMLAGVGVFAKKRLAVKE